MLSALNEACIAVSTAIATGILTPICLCRSRFYNIYTVALLSFALTPINTHIILHYLNS